MRHFRLTTSKSPSKGVLMTETIETQQFITKTSKIGPAIILRMV